MKQKLADPQTKRSSWENKEVSRGKNILIKIDTKNIKFKTG